MADDRTEPHPLYWAMPDHEYRGLGAKYKLGCRSMRSGAALSGAIHEDDEKARARATALTWAHADALLREGWLACCKEFRSYDDVTIDEFVGDVEARAPGTP